MHTLPEQSIFIENSKFYLLYMVSNYEDVTFETSDFCPIQNCSTYLGFKVDRISARGSMM